MQANSLSSGSEGELSLFRLHLLPSGLAVAHFHRVVKGHNFITGGGSCQEQSMANADVILLPMSAAIRSPGGYDCFHGGERFRSYRPAVEITQAENGAHTIP